MLSLRIFIGLQKIENSLIGGEGDSNLSFFNKINSVTYSPHSITITSQLSNLSETSLISFLPTFERTTF